MYAKGPVFCDKCKFKRLNLASMIWYDTDEKGRNYIDTLIIYSLLYEVSNDSDGQSDFGKN